MNYTRCESFVMKGERMTKLAKKIVATGAITALTAVAVALPFSQSAYADLGATQATQPVNVTVLSALTVNNQSGTDAMTAVDINYTAGQTGIEQAASGSAVNVKTNNPTGYKAYLTIDSSTENPGTSNSNAGVTDLVHTLVPANKLTAGNLTGTGQWAAKGGDISAWTAVPLDGNTFVLKNTSGATSAAGDDITATFGANIDAATPQGKYSNVVLYTAVPNP